MLYIDPGTGSMLITLVIGLCSALIFALRDFFIKIKYTIGGKKRDNREEKLDYVIFSDDKRYWNVFGPICDEFERRKVVCEYWTSSEDDPALEYDYKYVKCIFIGKGNKAFVKLNSMKAKICISTTPGLNVYQWKRSKYVDCYIHIYHAVSSGMGYRMFSLDFYDVILATGDVQEEYVRKIEDARKLKKKEIVIVGCSYLDELKKKYDEHNVENKNSNITILVAPTWGINGILAKNGEEFIGRLIQYDYNIVVRPHPQSLTSEKELLDRLKNKFKDAKNLTWNFDNDNFDALLNSDLMISDYSGVIYDYSFVFDKPVIFTGYKPNLDPFEEAWLDEPSWNFQVLPLIGKQLEEQDFEHIDQVIQDIINNEVYKENRATQRNRAWYYIGEGTERTVDYLQSKNSILSQEG